MSYTLSKLLQDALKLQGVDAHDLRKATGGSTTSFVDTTLTDKYDDDELLDGTVIVIRDAGGASAAPEGEFSRISVWVGSTQTATIDEITAGIGTGDVVMIVKPDYPLQTLIEFANDALRDCGEVTGVVSSTNTIADATEYSLPATCKRLTAVYLQTNLDDSDVNGWSRVEWNRVIPSAGNVAGTVVFEAPFEAGYVLQFVYDGFHPSVYNFDDAIDESIAPPLATFILADKIMQWHGVTDENRNYANKILSELAEIKAKYPVRRTQVKTNFLTWERSTFPSDD